MFRMKHLTSAGTVALLAGIAPAGQISQDPFFQMGQLTFLEAVTHVTRDLHNYGLEIDGPFTFNAQVTPAGFNGTLNGSFGGRALDLHYTGSTSGAMGQNASVVFSADGSLGGESFTLTGDTQWNWDSTAGDWLIMNYAEDSIAGGPARTGTPSRTVRAVELIAGVGVGGWFGGLVGALTGAGGAWTISNYAVAFTKSPTVPPPVVVPQPPVLPITPMHPPTGPQIINIYVGSGGTANITSGNSGNVNVINGTQNNTTVTGSGIPSPGVLATMPIACLWAARRRRAVAATT